MLPISDVGWSIAVMVALSSVRESLLPWLVRTITVILCQHYKDIQRHRILGCRKHSDCVNTVNFEKPVSLVVFVKLVSLVIIVRIVTIKICMKVALGVWQWHQPCPIFDFLPRWPTTICIQTLENCIRCVEPALPYLGFLPRWPTAACLIYLITWGKRILMLSR